jgi:hypothetical protein
MADQGVVLVEGYTPVDEPKFESVDYWVAPYYAPAYPVLVPYGQAFVYDEDYYTRYMTVWNGTDLPTEEMQDLAVPEGVLPSGSTLSGFLFFEVLDPGEEKVNFLAQLENAETHDYFGAVWIPMEPEGPLEP